MNDSYTVDQAHYMFCPQFLTNPDPDTPKTCCGSNCMAWRWSQAPESATFRKAVIAKARKDKSSWADAWDAMLKERGEYERTEGYCGLAGYPHNSLRP